MIRGIYELALYEAGIPQWSVNYIGHFSLKVNCSGGKKYTITGKMAGPDLMSGIELWVEDSVTGAIVSGPEVFEVSFL